MKRACEIVGASVPRVDGVEKVTGRARFTADIGVRGMAEAAVLRSPHAHARIRTIDTRAAEALPGVVAVLTRDDLRDIDPYLRRGERRDQPLIALDRALYAGQPVAAVAAEDRRTAEEALASIEVDYEPLPAACTVEEALAQGSPQIHPFAPGNVCFETRLEKGDVESGFREADLVFEDSFSFPMVYHCSLEPHATLAEFDGDGLRLWTSNTHPFGIRQELAELFRLPLAKVRVIVPYVGGAFGSKSGCKIEPLVAALARKAGRPVRILQSAADSMLTSRRHSAICRLKTGVMRDGTLVAKEAEILLDTGAFAETGPIVANRTLTRILGPYRIPHVRVRSSCVYTNTVSAASFRSIGGPQTAWATESQMDIIAARLGLDPVEFRRKNLLRRGEELKPRGKPLDADLFVGLERVLARLGWDGPVRNGAGRGVAFGVTDPGAPLASTATVHVLADGGVVLSIGTVENGQGAKTVMSQIVAEELRVAVESVTARTIDTAYTPFDRSTGSSRSTTVMGKAVELAAKDAREQIVALAADHFEAPPEAIRLENGRARAGGREASYGELIRRHFAMQGGEIIGRGYAHGIQGETPNPLFWEIGIGAAEVEVDDETGEVRIRRYVTGADVGRALHPKQCEGQDEGAAMMGIGHTLFESLRYEDGAIRNQSLLAYRVPRFRDLPRHFESVLIENEDGPGPYGAKGMGEGGIIPVAPAVANALAWSRGVRIKELPLTPERVWRALKEVADAKAETAR
jgi:CO/xanthine dehydrogenase Mo-binding subunit